MESCRMIAREKFFVFLMIWALIAGEMPINVSASADNGGGRGVVSDGTQDGTHDGTQDGTHDGTHDGTYEVSVEYDIQGGSALLSYTKDGKTEQDTSLRVAKGDKVQIIPEPRKEGNNATYTVKGISAQKKSTLEKVQVSENAGEYEVEVNDDTEIYVEFVKVHTLTVKITGTDDGKDLNEKNVVTVMTDSAEKGFYYRRKGDDYTVQDGTSVKVIATPTDNCYVKSVYSPKEAAVEDVSGKLEYNDQDEIEYNIGTMDGDETIVFNFAELEYIKGRTWKDFLLVTSTTDGVDLKPAHADEERAVYLRPDNDAVRLSIKENEEDYTRLRCKTEQDDSYRMWGDDTIQPSCIVKGIRLGTERPCDEKLVRIEPAIYVLCDRDLPFVSADIVPPLDSKYSHYNKSVKVEYVAKYESESGDKLQSYLQKVEYVISQGTVNIDEIAKNFSDVRRPSGKGVYRTADNVTYGIIEDVQGTGIKIQEGTIEVSEKEYNCDNVNIVILATDYAGKKGKASFSININTTKPVIDFGEFKEGRYKQESVTMNLGITDRASTFAPENVILKLTATNAKNERVDISELLVKQNENKIIGVELLDNEHDSYYVLTANEKAWITNGDKHTLPIVFPEGANYKLSVSYHNRADLHADSKDISFAVDNTPPTGVVKVITKDNKIVDESTDCVTDLTFNTFTNSYFTITAEAEDEEDISTIKAVKYYIHYGTTALSKNTLEAIADTNNPNDAGKWRDFSTLKTHTISEDMRYVFYLKIMDETGNVRFISTDGLIVDKTLPKVEASVKSGTGIHNSDVTVDVSVIDPIGGNVNAGATCSGIKSVTYKVLNMGEVTQKGELYNSKDSASENRVSELSGLKIKVDSQKNNSNDVVVEIYATDNATNRSETKKLTMKIDVTKPTIDIRYNNNSPGEDGYYKDERVATIEVTERNFDPNDVKIIITNTDGTIPSVSDWSTSKGGGNQDGTTHTAKIVYSTDGEYTFGIDYTDEAGNHCEKVEYASGTLNPTKFIIDQTDPKVTVRYDQNNVRNGKYFKDARVATVTITERNFKLNKAEFIQTASLGGGAISVPAVSWSHRGDVHIATIPYMADGDYTFDVKVGDMAGNETLEADYGDSASPKSFTIDRSIEEPIITGVEDGKAYKGDVIPSISFSDLNFDDYTIRLTRTRMAEKDKDVTALYIEDVALGARGGSVTSDTFEKIQANDGIYTLYAKVTDKAGNERENTVTFTVNRFGSVYEYSDYLISLIENGGAYAQEIEKDLVITEYNADRLLSGSMAIEITRDGRPLTDIKYDVSPEINGRVAVGESGWYQYTYTISKDNFVEDGIYKMFISSKDATGNAPETTNYKDKNILFRVDATKPELTSVVGLENSIVNANELAVSYTVYDAIGLKSIQVYLDDKLVGDAITDFTADVNNYSGSFKIPGSNTAQKVKLVIVDLAGNVTDTSAADFESAYAFSDTVTVSTNLFIRWYANKALFWGSIAAIVAVSFSIMFFVLAKRKKKRN